MDRNAVIGVLTKLGAMQFVDWAIGSVIVVGENDLEKRVNLCEMLGHRLTDEDKRRIAEYVTEGLDDDEFAKRAGEASYNSDFQAELKRAIAAE